jgi:hypothetical protein
MQLTPEKRFYAETSTRKAFFYLAGYSASLTSYSGSSAIHNYSPLRAISYFYETLH